MELLKVEILDFRTFVRIIASRWKIILAATVASLAAAVAITAVQTKTYQASATILVSFVRPTNVSDAYNAAYASQLRLSSYADIAGGRSVAQRAITQLGAPLAADDLVANTSVTYKPESTLFRLTVDNPDPHMAADLATAMAHQFAAMLPEVDPAVPDPEVGWDIGSQQNQGTARAIVVDEPAVPVGAAGPVPAKNVTIGLVAGVLLGVALALVRNATDRTIRSPEALIATTGLSMLAELPRPSNKDTATRRGGGRPTPADLVFEEEVRCLRTRLLGTTTGRTRSVLVTAPVIGQGATTTALNLAVSFTEIDQSVLLIEGDSRQTTIASLLGSDSSLGLADVMADEQILDDAVLPTAHEGLWVLASSTPGQIQRHFSTAQLGAIMEKLSGHFDRMVIVGPPGLIAADAATIAAAVDATVLVVRAGQTTIDEIDGALENLRSAGGQVVGAVLTAAPVSRHTRAAMVAYRDNVGDTASLVVRATRS
jgi:capsular exopolysaccharide synthesis family protein